MRKLLIILAFALSFNAYSFEDSWAFGGKGEWVTENGDKGKYEVEVQAVDLGDHINVTEHYKAEGSEETFQFTIVKKEHGFADILVDGEKVGQGYCFSSPMKRTCHHSYTYMGKTVEKTCHKHGKKVLRMGSVSGGDHPFVKFHDRLKAMGME